MSEQKATFILYKGTKGGSTHMFPCMNASQSFYFLMLFKHKDLQL